MLEHYLGVRLFLRERPGLRLTPDGVQYLAEVGPAFQTIIEATARLAEGSSREPLRLQVYPTFMAKWLMRRLPDFQARHPKFWCGPPRASRRWISRGTASTPASNWGTVPGRERKSPSCSRMRSRPYAAPRFWSRARRFGSRWTSCAIPSCTPITVGRDWDDWFDSLGLRRPGEEEPTVFASSLLTYQAAVDGLGIAMGQTKMLQKELESGTLICPYDHVVERDLGYYFVAPEGMGNRKRLRAFRSWLVDAARRDALSAFTFQKLIPR